MRAARQLVIPVLLSLAAGASAQAPARATGQVLALIPAQAQAVVFYPDLQRLEGKWAKVVGPFGGKDAFLALKGQTGIEPSGLEPGPLVRVSFAASGAKGSSAWLVPAKHPRALLDSLKPAQKGGVWTWEAPARHLKGQPKATPVPLFGRALTGYLVVADSEAGLAAFQKPASTLSAELAPYATWLESHDVSVVATKAAVEEGARSARQAFQPTPAQPGAEGSPVPAPAKTVARFQAQVDRWAELARTSVHHVLAGLDITEDGGVSFVAQALLASGSPLSQELRALPPVAGHPLRGLGTLDFALALGGDWTSLLDLQSALLQGFDKAGKVQPATTARLQAALAAQSGLTRSMAGVFAAPVARTSLLSGFTTLVRVSDSKAYFAAMEESSQAQKAFLQELGLVEEVTFTRDLLPGVSSCGVTTRFALKSDDPATASSRMAMAMLFGGETLQTSLGALDDHRVLAVMGGADLLKARLEEVRKAPEGLAQSILAVEPALGRDHRFALYLDPRGLRGVAQLLATMFGGPEAPTLPAIADVPAAGLTLSLDPAMVELRGAVPAETLRATAALFKAIGALFPAKGLEGRPPKNGGASKD